MGIPQLPEPINLIICTLTTNSKHACHHPEKSQHQTSDALPTNWEI